jgi:two-component system, chemotaxis family, protein-glutamate methylesterase/glutaminase
VTVAQMTKVLIADGPATDRAALAKLLRADPELNVVGEATHSVETVEMAKRLRPDIIVMGVFLPASGGFKATKEVMIEAPTPIVIVSDEHDARQVEMSILALRAGALAIASMPSSIIPEISWPAAERLIATVKAMSQVKVVRRWREGSRELSRPWAAAPQPMASTEARSRVVAMAASTGGPAALQQILSELPADFALPILVVQHIGSGFVDGLVQWLNAVCSLHVKRAMEGDLLAPHTVYVAPDDRHLGVSSRSRIVLSESGPIDGFRPSATFLFESVGRAFGSSAIHVILTGMGRDGVCGLKVARQCQGTILAQDQASSVVFGMPGAAIDAGLADCILPLPSIADQLINLAYRSRNNPRNSQ